jgi:hypothetical protein
MSVKKRDRAMQREVRERQGKTGESYQAAYQQLNPLPKQTETLLPHTWRETSRPLHRHPLPMSSGQKVSPGQIARITARVQSLSSFWPDRLLIHHADRWDVRRLSVGHSKGPWSSLIEDENQRRVASVFSLDTWHPLIQREVPSSESIVMDVTYKGTNDQGERFEAVLFGWDGQPPPNEPMPSKPEFANRVSMRTESKRVVRGDMIVLPITIELAALFVDRFAIAEAELWKVHDIRTHGKTIFLQGGDLPGEMFTDDASIILKPLVAGDRVDIAATYLGEEDTATLIVELSGVTTPPKEERAISYFLPMTADLRLLPLQSAEIKAESSRPFVVERLVISHPHEWTINDLKIGNRSQLLQSGDIPALTFSKQAIGCDLTLESVPSRVNLVIIATYDEAGDKEGASFWCGAQGRCAPESVT